MEFSSLSGVLSNGWIGNFLVWAVAVAAGLVGVVAVVSVLDMFFEAEAR
ncbi:hypothetical protein [Variovorax sp. PBL-E5]|nr:hypothetical protein [Variovorax sp. PBL-E5]VTU39059.1 hypothetical protein E5CHR_04983 [Variovorax sp. PBL-E5]